MKNFSSQDATDLFIMDNLDLSNKMKNSTIFDKEDNLSNGLFSSLREISKYFGAEIKMPDVLVGDLENRLRHIVDLSGFRVHKVLLHDPAWWKKDSGPLLVVSTKTQKCYSLFPLPSGGYRSSSPEFRKINQKNASEFDLVAYSFFLPFHDRPLKLWDVLKISISNSGRDMLSILGSQFIVSGIGILVPILFGTIVSQAIPLADLRMMNQILIGLVGATLSSFILTILQSIAFLRFKLKSTASVEYALWERLMRLPLSFFRQYGTGELFDRIKGVDVIFSSINSKFIQIILNVIMSIVTLIIMYVYDSFIGWIIFMVTFIVTVFLFFGSLIQLHFNRKLAFFGGRSSNLMIQMIMGIKKIKTTYTQKVFFKNWLQYLVSYLRAFMKATRIMISSKVVENYIMLLVTVILYNHFVGLNSANSPQKMNLGTFVTINSLMGMYIASYISLSTSLMSYINLIPLYDRIKPILESIPESRENENILYPFSDINKIEFKNVSFAYEESAHQALHSIQMSVSKGQFVAVVGKSGSGKSTLIRLLLGLEKPQEGNIYYDGIDLKYLPIQWIRSQCGIVLQSTNLMIGSIFDNITSFDHSCTEQDVQEAVRLANLEQDIVAMPMGLQTLVMDNGIGLSLGQRQRILIARALCHRPKILILDEATSALDNENQKCIHDNLNELQVTRFVVAHRLSTIQQADIIYVIEKGMIVESGSYDELVSRKSHFSSLMRGGGKSAEGFIC